jgi:uncharacterized protein (DUF2252 family)
LTDEGAAPPLVRAGAGKALRARCPRSGHGRIVLGQGGRDALALIEASNAGRLESLLPIRFTRMAESAFAFFRGTAALQAYDLAGTPCAGPVVQCCGDCHLMNFGGYASPERTLVFDINDFDETHPGPFEWDVKRLATSFVMAARWLDFTTAEVRGAARSVAAAYRQTMARFARMGMLETWYARVTMEEVFEEFATDPKMLQRLRKSVEAARHQTTEHVFHKITTGDGDRPRIKDQLPLLFHPDPVDLDLERDARPFFGRYAETLAADRRALFARFRLVDVAYKVVGVGSVGTRCYVALFCGPQGDHLFLQVKEARPSVLEGRAGPSPHANNGERVVQGQRLMQSASDVFLGWGRGAQGREFRDFYVRQLRDMKITPDLTGHTPPMLSAYAHLCGRVLARAHAKAGDAATISGYLGSSGAFDDAVASYAVSYANQVERDYEAFRAATRTGRFPAEPASAELEQALR